MTMTFRCLFGFLRVVLTLSSQHNGDEIRRLVSLAGEILSLHAPSPLRLTRLFDESTRTTSRKSDSVLEQYG